MYIMEVKQIYAREKSENLKSSENAAFNSDTDIKLQIAVAWK